MFIISVAISIGLQLEKETWQDAYNEIDSLETNELLNRYGSIVSLHSFFLTFLFMLYLLFMSFLFYIVSFWLTCFAIFPFFVIYYTGCFPKLYESLSRRHLLMLTESMWFTLVKSWMMYLLHFHIGNNLYVYFQLHVWDRNEIRNEKLIMFW